jgi:undecaprenyl-diphosphatase
MVGYFAILLFRSHRAGVVVVSATLVFVLAICFGRLYLGERYFSDIVSGLAAGVVWLAACITGLEVARRRGERETREGPGRRDLPDDALAG